MFKKILTMLLTLMPGMAFAAGNLFDPVPGDQSMKLLAAMFGKLGSFGPSSSDAFVSVILAFNGAVLVIGGVLVAYTIVAGTIGTAHDGEVLGKKFSSVWIPIRTAMGTALVLPVIGGGYCVMQAIVGWLIVQGIGLADNVWGTYMSASNVAKEVSIGLENPQNEQMGWKLFSSLVCVKGYEKIYSEAQSKNPTIWPVMKFDSTLKTASDGSSLIYFGAPNNENGFKYDSCGSIKMTKSQDFGVTALGSTGINLLGDLKSLNGLVSAGDAKHNAAINALITDLNTVATSFVANGSPTGVEAAVKTAVAKYSTSTKDAGAAILAKLADFNELEKSSTKDGWALAGAWYMRMSYLMDVASRTIAKLPEASGIDMKNDDINRNFKEEFAKKYSSGLNQLVEPSNGETGVSNSVSQSDVATGGGGLRGIWDTIKSGLNFDTILKKAFLSVSKFAVNSNDHPIMAMKAVGNWSFLAAAVTLPLYAAGMAALATATQGGGVALTVALLPFALMIWPPLVAIGFTLSYVLPMMPFIIWIGVVLGWVILCVEAIIAAPMWAVMHLSPNGDDMVGTGGQGYRLVLGLMLRPVLMIFGLIAALTIITVFGKLLNNVFFDVFILSQQDSNFIILIVGFIAAPLIYLGLMWTLITKTMSIIHVIPDQLLQWFGGGGQQLGDYGQTMGGHGSQTFAALSGGSGLASKGLEADRNRRDLGKQMEQAKLQDKANKDNEGARVGEAMKGFDKTLGAGGSGVLSKALLGMGKGTVDANGQRTLGTEDLNSHDAAKVHAQMKGAVDSLGGPESASGMAFVENMNTDMDNGMSYNDAFKKNLSSSLDMEFGSGTAQFLSQSSGGTFAGSGFAGGLEKIQSVKDMYKKLPLAEVKSKTSSIVNAAMSYSNKKGVDLSVGMDKAISHAYNNSRHVEPPPPPPPPVPPADNI